MIVDFEKGERVTIERYGHIIAEIVKPSAKTVPKFGTLKGLVHMTPEQFQAAARPMTDEEAGVFLKGRH